MEDHHAGKGENRPKKLLDRTDAIETAADSLAYYKDFANYYGSEFAAQLVYMHPIANFNNKPSKGTDSPIADIRCDNSPVAEALRLPRSRIYGYGISLALPDQSASKGLYGGLHCID
ncbi:MAG: hypothetical protein P8P16_02070 [Amylibacter sp.]|nr:hypothetical protein [Amylibacter sp.]